MRHSIFIIYLLLCGCATPPHMVYVRTDGKPAGDSAAAQQLSLDRTMCAGEAERAKLSAGTNPYLGVFTHAAEEGRRNAAGGRVEEGCMATKGYALVPETQAQQAASLYAETAKERNTLQPPQRSASR